MELLVTTYVSKIIKNPYILSNFMKSFTVSLFYTVQNPVRSLKSRTLPSPPTVYCARVFRVFRVEHAEYYGLYGFAAYPEQAFLKGKKKLSWLTF